MIYCNYTNYCIVKIRLVSTINSLGYFSVTKLFDFVGCRAAHAVEKTQTKCTGTQLKIICISHFLIETAKHAWIVRRDSAIESTSHETWNG